jgi:hypothetical protein
MAVGLSWGTLKHGNSSGEWTKGAGLRPVANPRATGRAILKHRALPPSCVSRENGAHRCSQPTRTGSDGEVPQVPELDETDAPRQLTPGEHCVRRSRGRRQPRGAGVPSCGGSSGQPEAPRPTGVAS